MVLSWSRARFLANFSPMMFPFWEGMKFLLFPIRNLNIHAADLLPVPFLLDVMSPFASGRFARSPF